MGLSRSLFETRSISIASSASLLCTRLHWEGRHACVLYVRGRVGADARGRWKNKHLRPKPKEIAQVSAPGTEDPPAQCVRPPFNAQSRAYSAASAWTCGGGCGSHGRGSPPYMYAPLSTPLGLNMQPTRHPVHSPPSTHGGGPALVRKLGG